MADSDFGQLYAELVMRNGVSPQLRQIVEDLGLVDRSIVKTRDLFSAFDDIELSHNVNALEKNWRNMRGAIADVRNEITKTQQKMQDLDKVGLGDSSEYKKYEASLKQLIKLRNELLSYGDKEKNAKFIGSEDITRFKGEYNVIKKEIAQTDTQSKRLMDTQKQNVAAVEKMVAEYTKMSGVLSGLRQNALDSGMTTMGTQWMQNTINQIQSVSNALRRALSDPTSITSNMMATFNSQFEQLTQRAARQADMMRDKLSAKNLMADSETSLTKMENKLETIKNKLRSIRETKGLESVDTSGLEAVQARLENFIRTYRNALSSGNFNKTVAEQLAKQFRQITADADKATTVIDGLVAAEKRGAQAAQQAARERQRAAQQQAAANQQAASSFDSIIAKMQQLQNATTRTGVIWDQFKTQIAFTAFSIYGLEHFLKSIITIGGEFERQRVALQNMLGDMREANEIFGQLKNLALESPFTFRQLSTYTKQLAAFSIPYEELYDTNRRLSDMSAGLGVDMSRLILAYGQVRAATVLRGQELRQFTEAGVPMVEKLADYFTKLNGELVTTRDIFQMISRKQVPFEAVRSVMQEMTDEGGMFYNMQAKIADTLSGRWGNLKDAWEILLGELADSESLTGNILKASVEGITSVIRHLRTLTGVLGGLLVGKALSGFGLGILGSVGGSMTGNLDKFYIKAKQMHALELQRVSFTRALSPIESEILRTKNRITEDDRLSMLRNGQLNKYQAALLVKNGQLNRMAAMRLALENGISTQEVRQLANASKLSLLWGNIGEKIKGFFAGINWGSLGITAAIMAIGAVAGAWVNYTHKMEEARKNIATQATETRNSLTEFFSNDQFSENLDAEEAKRYIEKYEDELKKIAPNFLEIKSRITGEHGESPQEQAKAYRDELQRFLDNSEISEHVAGSVVEYDDRGFGRDTFIEKANAYYREMRNLRDEVLRLDPVKLVTMVNSMDGLNEATKEQIRLLVRQGDKLQAIKRIHDAMSVPGVSRGVTYPDNEFYASYTGIYNRLFYDTDTKKEYKDAADEFFSQMKEDIKNSYSQYFDEDGKWIGGDDLRNAILKGMRDGLSERGADVNTLSGAMMRFELDVFQTSQSTAIDMLANAFVQRNQGLVAKFRASGGEVTDEIRDALNQVANNLALTDINFYNNLDYIFNGEGRNEIIKRLRVLVNVDDGDLNSWQRALVDRFGEEYKLTIKAAPDIASALEACQNLYDKAKGKIETMKPLMLQMGIKFSGAQLPEDSVPSFIAPQYQGLYKDFAAELNKNQKIIQSGIENGLKDKATKSGKGKKTGKSEDKELQAWQRHVELYKKFLDQYRDLTKMWGEKKALDTLRDSKAYEWVVDFAKARGLDITDIDAMNEALNGILDVNKGDKQKRKDAMAKRTADVKSEGYKRQGDALKRLNDQLNENLKILNEQYDAYLKIFQITGNKEGAMQLAFGGNVTNERYVDELTEELRDALKAVNWSGTIDDALEMTKEKVNEVFGEESVAANLINKLKEERNKLEKEYIDILANALTSDMSLEDKRAEAVRKHNEELRKLIELRDKAETAEGRAQVQAGIDALNNAHNRTMAGYDQQIFERDTNLGGLMNHLNVLSKGYLRALLVGLRDNMSKLANDNTPEGISAREKLAEQILKVTDALRDLNDTVTDLDADFYTGGDGKRYITGVTATRYGMKQDQEIDENTETIIRNAEEFRQLTKKISQINTLVKDLENVLKPVLDLFEAIGYEGNSLSKAIELASNALSAASNTTSSLSSLSQGAAAAGKTGLASGLAKAGPYAAVAAVGLSVVSQMFKWQQQAIQDDIDASKRRQQEMEALSSNLERVLERTLGGIYSMRASDAQNSKFSDVLKTFKVYNEGGNDALAKMLGVKGNFWNLWTYSQHDIEPALEKIRTYTKETRDAMQEALNSDSYYDANYASLLAQRDEMQRQLDVENDKKKRDLSAISDLEQNIIEIQDKIQYYALDIAKAIYDIDVKSWADSLAETIVDAWAKGEDAVDAYKKKVKELMRDVVTNIISQKIIQEALKRANVEGIITSEMEAKNGMLDEFSVRAIGDALVSATGQAVSNATKLLDYLKSVGWDLSDAADNASTLGKGIASITEDTADLLASYINAIRADVAAMRALEEKILESGFMDINSNLVLQLTELRNISAFAERNALAAERILELFDSVTTVGSNGRKVRV